MRICFNLHTIITRPYPKHKLYFIKSTPSISLNTTKISHIQQYNEYCFLIPSWEYASPPTPSSLILIQKHTFCFIKSTSNFSLITAKICTYKQLNEYGLLNRLCFNPHTTNTHPYQKHELCFINPHQPSHSRWFTTKIVYLQKQNLVTTVNIFITHPYPKLDSDASFSSSKISPMSLHMIAPITFASFLSFLSNCKLKRVRRKNYIPHNYLWDKKGLGGNSQHGGA